MTTLTTIAEGKDKAGAHQHAQDALETALQFYVDRGDDLPRPSKAKRGMQVISCSVQGALNLSLYASFRNLRRSSLLGVSEFPKPMSIGCLI